MHLQNNLIRCALHIGKHITVHVTVHITVPTNIRFSYYVLFKIMANKNHIYINYITPYENNVYLTLYDRGGGGGLKAPPLRFFALTHLIFELHYCALVTFPKK